MTAPVDRLLDRLDATSRDLVERARGDRPPAPPRVHPGEPRGLAAALRDAALTRSPALRHGVQVAAAAIVALVLARVLSPEHMSWIVVTTIAVLQPYPGATFGRILERVAGTILGCSVAALLVTAFHGALALTIAMVPLSAAAVVTRPRSYRLFVLFLTPVFVLMADHLHASWATLLARIGDVIVGGAIALAATAVLPTWERMRLPAALAALCDALARHADLAFAAWSSGRYHTGEQVAVRREVGAALEHAEASLERMLGEPARTRDDPRQAVFLVTYGRRLSNALTALDAVEERFSPEDAAALRGYLDRVLAHARAVVAGAPPPNAPREPPELRASPAVARLLDSARLVARIGYIGR